MRHPVGQIYGGDFAKICGLLRIYELYQPSSQRNRTAWEPRKISVVVSCTCTVQAQIFHAFFCGQSFFSSFVKSGTFSHFVLMTFILFMHYCNEQCSQQSNFVQKVVKNRIVSFQIVDFFSQTNQNLEICLNCYNS